MVFVGAVVDRDRLRARELEGLVGCAGPAAAGADLPGALGAVHAPPPSGDELAGGRVLDDAIVAAVEHIHVACLRADGELAGV